MTTVPVLSVDATRALHAELHSGESLLWSGQPIRGAQRKGFGLWLFAIPWTTFALFWETMAISPWFTGRGSAGGFGIIGPIFGLPFVAVGVAMMATPFFAVSRARRTVVALTTRRLAIVTWGRRRTVTSVLLDQIGPVRRSERPDGSGDLQVETHSHVDSEGDRRTSTIDVLGVPNVATLERLLLNQAVALRDASTLRAGAALASVAKDTFFQDAPRTVGHTRDG